MSIESIAPLALPTLAPIASPVSASALPAVAPLGGGFGSMVTHGLEQVNQALLHSQSETQALALGQSVNLHQVMVNLEESRLSFQLMMQVRSRLLEAYQDVMRMQI
ncbi:flagellar hook-basal body complex protein FliE [Duganella sacchari]|uniref:Flagellar hook-basal body complex protein FliE n=1 Tax=Duganella sacchari TaxID=551987 RepID=A0A1M7PLH7_9BURK|nr:flagellar hook-basal body complex protein FliE [Duganella sacchari]SHN18055.1 flagellar hook-basal body complex protein FliE [Duganella sacchari]